MKKIIAMLLVLVMSVTGLVGCGSSKDNEAGSTSASSDGTRNIRCSRQQSKS